jgi:hypothetical protein
MAGMVEHSGKRGPGRPPKHGDMAEVAYVLKDLLGRTKANQKAFSDIYQGTTSGKRLRRGLARLLADDPEALAFFDGLISSDDGK